MRVLGLAVLAIAATSLAAQQDLAARLDDYLQRCVAHGFRGSVLVAKDGAVVLRKGYGLADVASKRANSPETLFEIASTTKQFTGAAILKLEAQGKLSTDDPITEHLPGVPDHAKAITIYHLLTHTSGMPRRATGGAGHDLERAVRGFLRTKPVRAPGEKHEYWNGGYALLAGIVERVSGRTYMDYCREELFVPAGLAHTGFTGDADLGAPVAVAYGADGKRSRSALEHPYRYYGWQYKGMGGAVSNVDDLYAWWRALQTDKVLDAKTRQKLFQPHRGNYACGWQVLAKPRKLVAHGGDVRGFHTQYMMFPDQKAAVIVMCNVDGIPLFTVSYNLRSLLFGEPLRYPTPSRIGAWPKQSVAGRYRIDEENSLELRRDGDELVVGGLGRATLAMLDDSLFARMKKRANAPLERRATKILEELAAGESASLREHMDPRIPAGWPDDVAKKLWPAQVAKWGALHSVRSAGASMTPGGRTEVLIERRHEKGTTHTRVAFDARGKLVILALDGPEFAASARMKPTADGRFERHNWMQKRRLAIAIERDKSGDVIAVNLHTATGKVVRAVR